MPEQICRADSACTNAVHVEAHLAWLRGDQWRFWIPRVWWRPSTWFSPEFGRWSTGGEMAEIRRMVERHIDAHRRAVDD